MVIFKDIKVRIAAWAILLIITIELFSELLAIADDRQGYQINDPIIAMLEAREFSILIFILTYGSVAASLTFIIPKLKLLELVLSSYLILTIIRIACIYFIPLEPPFDTIPLSDPILEATAYKGKKVLSDLFFSGHISAMVLLALFVPYKPFKLIIFLMALIVSVLLLMQHVHYSIDLIFAPFFSLLAYYLSKKICAGFY